MCGWVFIRQKGLRRMPAEDLKARVTKQWLPGPVVFPRIMATPDGAAVECCQTCLKRPGNRTAMLAMDQYLLYLMAPTTHPDLRRHKRMRTSLLRVHRGRPNPYAGPAWLVDLARAGPDAVRAWWHRNLRTQFFKHKHTARVVRIALRGGD